MLPIQCTYSDFAHAELFELNELQVPFSIDRSDFAVFVVFSILSCPPNALWQEWLEAQFPGYTEKLTTLEKEKAIDDAVTGSSSGTSKNEKDALRQRVDEKTISDASTPLNKGSKATQLNLKNTAIKFALDQTVGATFNTILFIAGIALLRGQGLDVVQAKVKEEFWPLIFASQKLWPAVSVISFTLIPVERRMLFGSIVGFFWGAYLSLVSGEQK